MVTSKPRVIGKHEIQCCGSCVKITPKAIRVLTEPAVEYCPLHESLYGTKTITEQTVRASIQQKIVDHCFCCRQRNFNAELTVAYGASEMMSVWLRKGLIDCAVTVCEGAGTVITGNSELVQGIGARLTGIMKTTPISEIIDYIQHHGGTVLDPQTAAINQARGVKHALKQGKHRVAVTVASFQAKAISQIRRSKIEPDSEILVFSVCNTKACEDDLKHIAEADIVCASASKLLRDRLAKESLLQLGVTIPVYALTQKAKGLILAYLAEFGGKVVTFRTKNLPYGTQERGPRLRGNLDTKTFKCKYQRKSARMQHRC